MDIRIRVTANARKDSVTEGKGGVLRIGVREKAEGGRANLRVREILASRFSVPLHGVIILKGLTSPHKHVRIYSRDKN